MDREKAIEQVLDYHEKTKHHPNRHAKGPGQMDWANKPEPFRSYKGAESVRLPLLAKDPAAPCSALYGRTQNMPLPMRIEHVASMLELSMGLSAWKSSQGSSWALRMNPSSGNLHPTEAYLILPPLVFQAEQGGVFHYNPYSHSLEQRAAINSDLWDMIRDHFGSDLFFLGLSSIYWRESWKYGERAFRYCNLDTGHAVACLSFAANLHGWHVRFLSDLADKDIETMLGLDKTVWHEQEREWPDLLLMVHSNADKPGFKGLPPDIINSFYSLQFRGSPNQLSRIHAGWEIIDKAAAATEKVRSPEFIGKFSSQDYIKEHSALPPAATVIRQRRSGQEFDSASGVSREVFFAMLDKTVPRQNCAPFDVGIGDVSIHLAIFVHRVTELEPGLYLLVRAEEGFRELKDRCRNDLMWQSVSNAPGSLRLYLLEKGDCTKLASAVSCYQDIAGKSAFSLCMLARFRERIEKDPSLYRRLFWEAGMIGQILYLEAEAHGLRGTGIGCFYDDMIHRLLDLTDDSYQDLYHFTVGRAIEDRGIKTRPPYNHLRP